MDRSKRFTLFALPDRPVHSDTNSASPGSIPARQQLRAETKSLTFPPLSIARYTFIQLSHQGRQWRERKCPIFETVAKGDSNPGSVDCESGILPLSYRAPRDAFSATRRYVDNNSPQNQCAIPVKFERSASALRRWKTFIRETLSRDGLPSLPITHIIMMLLLMSIKR